MKYKLALVLIWSIIWTIFCILFIDFLSIHPHLKYSVLLSPFILVTTLLNLMELLDGHFPKDFYIGLLYWLITLFIMVLPKEVLQKSKLMDRF
jgi:hypothetical protein